MTPTIEVCTELKNMFDFKILKYFIILNYYSLFFLKYVATSCFGLRMCPYVEKIHGHTVGSALTS